MSPVIFFRAPAEVKAKLKSVATKEKTTVSALIRRAVLGSLSTKDSAPSETLGSTFGSG